MRSLLSKYLFYVLILTFVGFDCHYKSLSCAWLCGWRWKLLSLSWSIYLLFWISFLQQMHMKMRGTPWISRRRKRITQTLSRISVIFLRFTCFFADSPPPPPAPLALAFANRCTFYSPIEFWFDPNKERGPLVKNSSILNWQSKISKIIHIRRQTYFDFIFNLSDYIFILNFDYFQND